VGVSWEPGTPSPVQITKQGLRAERRGSHTRDPCVGACWGSSLSQVDRCLERTANGMPSPDITQAALRMLLYYSIFLVKVAVSTSCLDSAEKRLRKISQSFASNPSPWRRIFSAFHKTIKI
jgi:hypothetical protein